jgi:cob(I)alamin adenosyltransferase
MIRLDRIYTRAGDGGDTRLGSGATVRKDAARVEAYGAVDELNAVLGLARTASRGAARDLLASIQHDLFDAGADLCVPPGPSAHARRALRVAGAQTARLERAIDRANARLRPLKSFVLPGGTAAAAWLHLARTICRRAERRVVTLAAREPVNPEVPRYLNRLSDLLFVLARAANRGGRADLLWTPGRHRGGR